MVEEKKRQPRFMPKLGLFDATAISVGAIIGGGIFVVTGIAAGRAGSALIISMLLAAVISVFTALSFAELTAWQPREGSVYEYVYQLISPFAGFLTGWMWILSNTFAGAAVALGFGYYSAALVPNLPTLNVIAVEIAPSNYVAALVCVAFTVLNYLGVRESALLNNFLVTAKLLILSFFIALGLWFVNVPRAILLSLAISTIVYVLVGAVAVGLVGAPSLAASTSPLKEAISATGNGVAVYVVSVGGLLATASVLLTSILGVSRMAYAMAQRRDLPHALGKLHPRYGTPYLAVWLVGVLASVLVLFVDLTRVVAVSTFALLFYYTLANVSALRLKAGERVYPRFVPVLGAATCVVFLVFTLFASLQSWIIGVACLIVGALYYFAKQKLT